jgi:rRNA maturation protein Nop10
MKTDRLRKCSVCDNYTMKGIHHGEPTVSAHPMRYTKIAGEEYSKYRVGLLKKETEKT